jgi:transposase-like protein
MRPGRPAVPICPRCAESTSVVRHSIAQTRTGARPRFRCGDCKRTFTQKSGTPYHRMRHRPSTFDRVMAMVLEGMSKASIARCAGVCATTVARWTNRGAGRAAQYSATRARGISTAELQVDELRSRTLEFARPTWVHTSVDVESRLWLGLRVGTRSLRQVRLHFNEIQSRLSLEYVRPLVVSDGYPYTRKAVDRVFGPLCMHAEVVKRYVKRRIAASSIRLRSGSQARVQAILKASSFSYVVNTSCVERLNLTLRRSLAALHRRTNAVCRTEASLEAQLELLRCYYNFVRPHQSLRQGRQRRTPAMAAGLTKRPLTLREIFSTVIPATELRRAAWPPPHRLCPEARFQI